MVYNRGHVWFNRGLAGYNRGHVGFNRGLAVLETLTGPLQNIPGICLIDFEELRPPARFDKVFHIFV